MNMSFCRPAILLCVQLGCLGAAIAATPEPLIVKVEVRGLHRVDKQAALAHTKLSHGMQLDVPTATRDLRAVWGSGFFKDVQLFEQQVEGGIQLIYSVVEKPSIKAVRINGHDAVSEDDIKAVIDVKPFTILNTDLLKRNVEKIKDLYVGKGHYLAEVSYSSEPVVDEPHEVEVVFDIVEHAKVRVATVSVSGNKHLSADTIKSALQTKEGNELSFLTQSGTYKQDVFETDMLRIQALYWDQGFVTVKVGQPYATISADRRQIYLAISIDEGEQYRVGKIRFSGDVTVTQDGTTVVDEALLRRTASVVPETTFSRSALFADVQALTDIYRDYGYAFANVTPNSAVNASARTVDLDFEVERGDEVYFDHIEVAGNVRTRDKVVRRELRIFEGQKFSAAAVNLSRARVFQLGYFETVNINTAKGSSPHKLDVVVEVKEKSTGTFQIGAGLNSYESFIATAQISQNNFLGNGQMMALSMHLSFGKFAQQLAQFQFQEPYFLDSNWALGLSAFITQKWYGDFQRNAKGFAPSVGYPLTHDLRLSAGYTFEYVELTTQNADVDTVLYNLSRAGRVSALSANLSFDTRDNRLFPTRGMFEELRGEFSTRWLGADAAMAFKRIEFDARFYHPVIWGTVFRLNAQLGYVFGPTGGVPISERYFPGGILTVRGFSPRGLGPVIRVASDRLDPAAPTRDFTIGGNKQAIFNLELEFPIVPAAGVRGVLFVDAGNAFDDDEGMFYIGTQKEQRSVGYAIGSNAEIQVPLGLFYSCGFGVRWLSPIGPLRFEWGIPLTKHGKADDPLIFEFTIGNFF